MMKRILLLVALWIGMFGNALAQMDLTFFHVGKDVPQSAAFQPVAFPDARVYFSLPVLPNIDLNLKSPLTYRDVFGNRGDTVYVNDILNKLGGKDRISFDLSYNLLSLGFRLKNYGAVTVFVNERISTSLGLPTRTANYLISNEDFIGQEFVDDDFGYDLNHFREYGVGYIHQLEILGGKKLKVGGRFKYLQGIFNAESSPNASITAFTDSTFVTEIRINEPRLNTAGFSPEENTYYLSNSNTGFAVDIGGELEVNSKLTVGLGLNDIGSISWTEEVENYSLNGTSIILEGGKLTDLNDKGLAIQDSLESFTEEVTDTEAYTTVLPARLLLYGQYEVIKNGTVHVSTLFRMKKGNHAQAYSLGYTHEFGKILDISTTATYRSQQGFNLGGGFSTRFGPVQLYTSFENILGYISSSNIAENDSFNARFGINFLIGHTLKKEKKEKTKKSKSKKE